MCEGISYCDCPHHWKSQHNGYLECEYCDTQWHYMDPKPEVICAGPPVEIIRILGINDG